MYPRAVKDRELLTTAVFAYYTFNEYKTRLTFAPISCVGPLTKKLLLVGKRRPQPDLAKNAVLAQPRTALLPWTGIS